MLKREHYVSHPNRAAGRLAEPAMPGLQARLLKFFKRNSNFMLWQGQGALQSPGSCNAPARLVPGVVILEVFPTLMLGAWCQTHVEVHAV